ncbi:MAG: YkgJ family cysteine cluster protein [Desulfobacterales bacterium]|jgi:Fe-S-cluster containining protein
MDLTGKLTALDKIYSLYDQFAASLDLACKKYCSYCCTTGVTLTTIEAYKIIKSSPNEEWSEKIQKAAAQPYFKPQITTNQLANLCADGIEPPEEESSEWKSCPLLTENQCPIYAVRPFGCRCLVSRHDCGKKGYADMDDFVLSVNTLFLQTIEHMDAGGCCGNMLDVLEVMASSKHRQAYKNNRLNCATVGLIANHPLKILMIPPEHRTRMEPILQSLRGIRF